MMPLACAKQLVKQLESLNQIIDELFSEHHNFNEDRLKELLGHTPFK